MFCMHLTLHAKRRKALALWGLAASPRLPQYCLSFFQKVKGQLPAPLYSGACQFYFALLPTTVQYFELYSMLAPRCMRRRFGWLRDVVLRGIRWLDFSSSHRRPA